MVLSCKLLPPAGNYRSSGRGGKLKIVLRHKIGAHKRPSVLEPEKNCWRRGVGELAKLGVHPATLFSMVALGAFPKHISSTGCNLLSVNGALSKPGRRSMPCSNRQSVLHSGKRRTSRCIVMAILLKFGGRFVKSLHIKAHSTKVRTSIWS